MFNIDPQQILLDNLNVIDSPDMNLGGKVVAICNVPAIPQTPISGGGGGDVRLQRQLDALLRIKNAVDKKSGALTEWNRANGANGRYCEWKGVRCDEAKNVVGVGAHFRETAVGPLRGVLPDVGALQELPKLIEVWFSQDELEGTLPPEYGALTGLVHLSVHYTSKLRGTLPASWSSLTRLQELYVSNVYEKGRCSSPGGITGTLPAAWSTMRNLKVMHLSCNKLQGSLPSSWGALTRLEALYLDHNRLSGTVPSSWGGMSSSLTKSTLWNNPDLGGCIPANWKGRVNAKGEKTGDGGTFGTEELFGLGNKITGFCKG
jgi:hypothetical protein